MTRVIAHRLYFDWDRNGAFGEDEGVLISARGDMRLTPPEDGITSGRGMISAMTLTLRNANGKYSSLRFNGSRFDNIRGGGMYHAPCYLEVSTDGGSNYERVFTGVVKLPTENATTSKDGPTVMLDARSMEEALLQRRVSTPAAQFIGWHDDGATEAAIIADLLDDADVDAGDTDIDTGIFTIPWAWLDDESVIETLWSLAGSAGGRYYADPDGVHRYENFTHWQHGERSKTSQYRYTKDDYRRLTAVYNDRDLYSEIKIELTPLAEAYSSVAWEAEAPILVFPGRTETVVAELDHPLAEVTELTYIARTLGGIDATADITVTPTYYAQRVSLAIENAGDVLVSVAKLKITGRLVEADAAQTVTKNATDDGTNGAFFTDRGLQRTRKVTGRRWVQTLAHGQALAQYLLDQSEYPRLTYRLSSCPGNPGLRLGDRISIADREWAYNDGTGTGSASIMSDETRTISADETISGTVYENGEVLIETTVTVTVSGTWILQSTSRDAYVTSISWQIDSAGFRQDIEAVDVKNMYPHDGQYFILDDDTLDGGKVVFY